MSLNPAGVNIGERIRLARERRGLSLGRLAQASGLTKGFISQVEHGRSQPSLHSLFRIAASLDLPLQSLLGGLEAQAQESSQLPQVFSLTPGRPSEAGVAPLLSSAVGTLLSARLEPGMSLAAGGSQTHSATQGARPPATQGLCVVIAGEAVFSQDGAELRLAQNEALAWDAGRAYCLENRTPATCSLILSIAPGGDLPAANQAEGASGGPVQGAAARSQTPPVEGPLRLVAMRAQRRSGGR